MLFTPRPVLVHGAKGTIGVIAVTHANETILQPRAERARDLATALFTPELEGLFVRLRHDATLAQMTLVATVRQPASGTGRSAIYREITVEELRGVATGSDARRGFRGAGCEPAHI